MTVTKRQFEFLKIVNDLSKKGFAPSLQEIADAFGRTSLASIYGMIHRLMRKSCLKFQYNRARSIELTPKAKRLVDGSAKCPHCGVVIAI